MMEQGKLWIDSIDPIYRLHTPTLIWSTMDNMQIECGLTDRSLKIGGYAGPSQRLKFHCELLVLEKSQLPKGDGNCFQHHREWFGICDHWCIQ